MSTLLSALGSFKELPRLLGERDWRRPLVIATASCFERTSIEQLLSSNDIEPKMATLPSGEALSTEAVSECAGVLLAQNCDSVVGIGGGTAMDLAKLVALVGARAPRPDNIAEILSGSAGNSMERKTPLALIPTTCGTGSEASIFAVYCDSGSKRAIENQSLLPDLALVDAELSASVPHEVAASSAVDALCQSIESYWSAASTELSRKIALEAVRLIIGNIHPSRVRNRYDALQKLAVAATLSGQAISLTRTTGPHALSYPLSELFGIPHGHACFLTLPAFFLLNSRTNARNCQDPRGYQFVREIMGTLSQEFGCATASDTSQLLRQLGLNVGLTMQLSKLGLTRADIEIVSQSTLDQKKMCRNPRRVSQNDIRSVLLEAY